VRGQNEAILPRLTVAGAQALIDQGIATGGMQAKLEAACRALAEGVGEVRILPGAEPDIVARTLAGEAIGTRLVLEASS